MREIPLIGGEYATVDDEDFEWLSQFTWWLSPKRTAVTYDLGGEIEMGWLIMNHGNFS